MISPLFDRGRRLFSTSAIVTLGAATFHTYGSTRPVPPDIDPVAQVMQNASLDLGFGMTPSVWDIHMALAFTMSVSLFLMGGLGLVLAATNESTSRVLSRTAATMATGCVLLTALYYVFRIPAPMLSYALLSLLWGLSMRTTRLA